MRQLVYLHGFASSPGSGKAAFFARRLAALGQPLHCPDLNEPDFSTLTVTRMIGQVEALIGGLAAGPVALIGSSLGAFVALHVAARQGKSEPASPAGERTLAAPPDAREHPIDRLVLLAPALRFSFDDNRLGEGSIARWRETGHLDVYHYAYRSTRPLGFAIYEDARAWNEVRIRVDMPTLIFQGRQDDVIDPASVEAFARSRPNVTLRLLDDGHQLQRHLEEIWAETAAFLDLGRAAGTTEA